MDVKKISIGQTSHYGLLLISLYRAQDKTMTIIVLLVTLVVMQIGGHALWISDRRRPFTAF